MKLKAIILSFIVLFGGSGLSIDLAQCCNKLDGISISFGAHNNNPIEKDCCHCIKIKKNKSCCDDVVVQTPINSVLYNKVETKKSRIELPILSTFHSEDLIKNSPILDIPSYAISSDALCEIPLLLKKRVLQI